MAPVGAALAPCSYAPMRIICTKQLYSSLCESISEYREERSVIWGLPRRCHNLAVELL